MGGKRRFSESTVHSGTESEERIAANRIMMALQSQFTQSVRVKEAAFIFPLNAVVPLINLLLSVVVLVLDVDTCPCIPG